MHSELFGVSKHRLNAYNVHSSNMAFLQTCRWKYMKCETGWTHKDHIRNWKCIQSIRAKIRNPKVVWS